MSDDLIRLLQAKATEKWQRDANAVGRDNVSPIETYLDWQAATALSSLRKERDAAIREKEETIAEGRDVIAGHTASWKKAADARDAEIASLRERVRVLESLENMLLLCGEAGGKKENETPTHYLRRLIDYCIQLQLDVKDLRNALDATHG